MIKLYVETTIGLLECEDVHIVGVNKDELLFKGRVLPQEQDYTSHYAVVVIDAFERRGRLPGTFVEVGAELRVSYSVTMIRETTCQN